MISSSFLSDDQVLEDAVDYWTKVKEGRTLADVTGSHMNQKTTPSKKDRSFLSMRSKKESRSVHDSYKMDDAHGSLSYADLNLGLAHFCRKEDDKALHYLNASLDLHPSDPTPHLRIGQIKSSLPSTTARKNGHNHLRTAHAILQNQPSPTTTPLLIEASASYMSTSYSNSELKTATLCADTLLQQGRCYASDEALCTKSQIMLRRGQYSEAQKFYRSFGTVPDPRTLFEGCTLPKIGYVYSRMEGGAEVGGGLEWTRSARRRETLRGAENAYGMDPRHLSR